MSNWSTAPPDLDLQERDVPVTSQADYQAYFLVEGYSRLEAMVRVGKHKKTPDPEELDLQAL